LATWSRLRKENPYYAHLGDAALAVLRELAEQAQVQAEEAREQAERQLEEMMRQLEQGDAENARRQGVAADRVLEDAERALIRSAIRRNGGSVQAAAEALGLSRSAMYRRLEKLGLKPDELQ